MDLDRYLLQVQGCLISTHNTLQSVCTVKSDDEVSHLFADKIKRLMEKWPDNYDVRKVCLYLVCNSDLESVSFLSEDKNVGHIVHTAPCLSKFVMCKILYKLGLFPFLKDLIGFGPHTLSANLIDSFIVVCQPNETDFVLDVCSLLLKACYYKLSMCEAEGFGVQFKFFCYFKQLFDIISNLKPHVKGSSGELYSLAGRLAVNLLEICSICVEHDCTRIMECWECYLLHCEADCDEWVAPSNEICLHDHLLWQCRDLVFSTCIKNLASVTVDVWLLWAEIIAAPNVTMQQFVGEAAYECYERLKSFAVTTSEFKSLTDLCDILSQMGRKPRCEDDEVKESSLSDILESLKDENKCKKVWLKGLLQHEEALESFDSLLAIETYSNILGEEDAISLIEKIVLKLIANDLDSISINRLISLTCNVMKHFSLDSHVRIVQEFNEYKYEISCESFVSLVLSVFNKLIDTKGDHNESLCEAASLCIFNSKAVVLQALKMGLEGQPQCTMMSKFLVALRPISQIIVEEWLKELSCKVLTDEIQTNIFPYFVAELVEGKVLTLEYLIKKNAMPAISNNLNTCHFNMVLVWISTLHHSLKFDMSYFQDVNVAFLVVFIGQVLERCLLKVSTFNLCYLDIRDKALSLLEKFKEVELGDQEQNWLSIQITNHSPTVFCYLKHFSDKKTPVICDGSSNDGIQFSALKYCFPEPLKNVETATFILVEMLPSLTMNEWNDVADYLMDCFVSKENKSWIVFQVYRKCMILLGSASCSDALTLELNHISCLNYCVRCFGSVLQQKIILGLDSSYHLTVFLETLHILSKLPSSVWDGGVIFLIPLLLDLTRSIPRNSMILKQIKAIFNECPENGTRSLIETKLFEGYKVKA